MIYNITWLAVKYVGEILRYHAYCECLGEIERSKDNTGVGTKSFLAKFFILAMIKNTKSLSDVLSVAVVKRERGEIDILKHNQIDTSCIQLLHTFELSLNVCLFLKELFDSFN